VARTTVWYVLLTIFGKLIVEQACRRDNLRVLQVGRAIGRHRERACEEAFDAMLKMLLKRFERMKRRTS
jgi:hypothetical protein